VDILKLDKDFCNRYLFIFILLARGSGYGSGKCDNKLSGMLYLQ